MENYTLALSQSNNCKRRELQDGHPHSQKNALHTQTVLWMGVDVMLYISRKDEGADG